MHRSVAQVLDRLKSEGMATDAAYEPARAALRPELESHLPWFLRVAVGLGAWVATGFLLGFFVALAQLDNPIVRIVVGAALVAGGVYVRHTSVSEFRKHAAVAGSLAGQALIIAGIHEFTDSLLISSVALFALSLGLIAVFRDGLHRFLSTLAACGAAYVAFTDERGMRGFEIITIGIIIAAAVVWRYRLSSRSEALADVLRPVGYALVVAFFAALLADTVTHYREFAIDTDDMLRLSRVATVVLMLGLSWLAWAVVDEHSADRPAAFAAITGVIVLGLATLSTPGILGGAAVLALAFDRRDRVLLGMGVIFLLVFGSVYYYSLNLTLLEKSGVLVGSGMLLLAIRHRLTRA
ncbi:MAG TPA: DUF4401 domain-containing protein [Gemmatimonadaceae bacterium]|nr:DUF4401 domain-containing protein [Gemmatimonadaceae bacterium]